MFLPAFPLPKCTQTVEEYRSCAGDLPSCNENCRLYAMQKRLMFVGERPHDIAGNRTLWNWLRLLLQRFIVLYFSVVCVSRRPSFRLPYKKVCFSYHKYYLSPLLPYHKYYPLFLLQKRLLRPLEVHRISTFYGLVHSLSRIHYSFIYR